MKLIAICEGCDVEIFFGGGGNDSSHAGLVSFFSEHKSIIYIAAKKNKDVISAGQKHEVHNLPAV